MVCSVQKSIKKTDKIVKNSINILLLSFMLGVSGCSVNPATGKREFTPLMPQSSEKKIGSDAHKSILAEYDGEYNNPKVKAYVQKVTKRITSSSELPSDYYTVTVLNSPVVNAFALPGGYLYVTRGLIGLANSEAELAGVLGHESGHVTARHAAGRSNVQAVAGLGAMALGMLTGNQQIAQLAQTGAQGLVASYSRSDEYQADELGVRYLTKAKYNPYAQSHFLNNLNLYSQYESSLRGDNTDDAPSFFATHPNTGNRVSKAAALAQSTNITDGFNGYNEHIAATTGMIWGDDPSQGIVQDNVFSHKDLRFRFIVPSDFTIDNQTNAVYAKNPSGAFIQFTMDKPRALRTMMEYLPFEYARNMRVMNLQQIDMPNMRDAATAQAVINTQSGQKIVRLYTMMDDDNKVYRFMMGVSNGNIASWEQDFLGIARSLRKLSDAEIRELKPYHIEYVKISPSHTVQNFVSRMAIRRNPEQLLRAINGLSANDTIPQSGYMKIIVR